jgi:hypothetical protein
MDHNEQALSDLSKQFAELKQEFTKILKMRGIPGPTGPAGCIDAAVNNARDVAEQVAITVAKKAVVYPFQSEVAKLREEFDTLKAHIDNAIVHHIVETLQDYGVLDENMNPLNKAHINYHLKQLGILSN